MNDAATHRAKEQGTEGTKKTCLAGRRSEPSNHEIGLRRDENPAAVE